MKIIGVVGGIGSGKSTVVSQMSETVKAYVINADHIGHDLLKKDGEAYLPLIAYFGDEIIGEDGEINRKALGCIVFSDMKKLQKLNNITHPLIYQKVKEKITVISKTQEYEYIIIDAALLIEIKLIELVDEVWGVYVPTEHQVERIMSRDGLTKDQAINRIGTQLQWEEIKKIIDVEINNARGMIDTKEQIISLLREN